MRILIVSSILHPRYGGPVSVIRSHLDALKGCCDVSLVGVCPRGEEGTVRELFPEAVFFPAGFPGRWFRGVGMARALGELARDCDVLHAHMLWDYAVFAAWCAARQNGKPLVVTPHGSVLGGWRVKSLHKRLYHHLILKRVLNDIACVQALSSLEEQACRDFGISSPIKVVPNGLPLESFNQVGNPKMVEATWPELRGKRCLLYVGRLWKGKGLELLLRAWAGVKAPEWVLVLAGPDYRGYQVELEGLIRDLNLTGRVVLPGMITGEIKQSFFAKSECVVLPSEGEAFSMVMLEALASGKPIVFSNKCGFSELSEHGGGWEVGLEAAKWQQQLGAITAFSRAELAQFGVRGREFGKARYTTGQVVAGLTEIYKTVLAAN